MILLVELDVGIAFLTFALSSDDNADGAEGIVAACSTRWVRCAVGSEKSEYRVSSSVGDDEGGDFSHVVRKVASGWRENV
jgi:hypothetical protein